MAAATHSEGPLGLREMATAMEGMSRPPSGDMEILNCHICKVVGWPAEGDLCAVFVFESGQLQDASPFVELPTRGGRAKRAKTRPQPRAQARLRRLLWDPPATSPLINYRLLVRRTTVLAVLDATNTALTGVAMAVIKRLLAAYGGITDTSIHRRVAVPSDGGKLRCNLSAALPAGNQGPMWLVDGLNLHGYAIAAVGNFFFTRRLRAHMAKAGSCYQIREVMQERLDSLEREHRRDRMAMVTADGPGPLRLHARRVLRLVHTLGIKDATAPGSEQVMRPPPDWVLPVIETLPLVEALLRPPAYFTARGQNLPDWVASCALVRPATAVSSGCAAMHAKLAELETRAKGLLRGLPVLWAHFPRSLYDAIVAWLGRHDADIVEFLGAPPRVNRVRVVVADAIDMADVPEALRAVTITAASAARQMQHGGPDADFLIMAQAQDIGLAALVHLLRSTRRHRVVITGCPDVPPRAGTLGDIMQALCVTSRRRLAVREVGPAIPSAEALLGALNVTRPELTAQFVDDEIPELEMGPVWCTPGGEMLEDAFGLEEIRQIAAAPGDKLARLCRIDSVARMLDTFLLPYNTTTRNFDRAADPRLAGVMPALPPFCRVVAADERATRDFMAVLRQHVDRLRGVSPAVEDMDPEVREWRDRTERGRAWSIPYLPIYPGCHIRGQRGDVKFVTGMASRYVSGMRPVERAYCGNAAVVAECRGGVRMPLASGAMRAECVPATEFTVIREPVVFVLLDSMTPGVIYEVARRAKVVVLLGPKPQIVSVANLARPRTPTTMLGAAAAGGPDL